MGCVSCSSKRYPKICLSETNKNNEDYGNDYQEMFIIREVSAKNEESALPSRFQSNNDPGFLSNLCKD